MDDIQIYETQPFGHDLSYRLKVWQAGATYRATLLNTETFDYLTLRKEEWETIHNTIEIGIQILKVREESSHG